MLRTSAPAKINLYLHITGKRDDGYHLLDSLVAFTNIGDFLSLEEAESFAFEIDGPRAQELSLEPASQNLVVRAARTLAEALKLPLNIKLTLTKNLPLASGIGGGSSDAAAAFRLLAEFWGMAKDDPLLPQLAESLGQDVPCCLNIESCYFRETGNVVDRGPEIPHTHIVLVNPNKALPTPAVYKERMGDFTLPARLERMPKDAPDLALMLRERGNGLQDAACSLMPEIKEILMSLAMTSGCLLARMSGSGATCFGLYADRSSARSAALEIFKAHPDWWVVPGFLPK